MLASAEVNRRAAGDPATDLDRSVQRSARDGADNLTKELEPACPCCREPLVARALVAGRPEE